MLLTGVAVIFLLAFILNDRSKLRPGQLKWKEEALIFMNGTEISVSLKHSEEVDDWNIQEVDSALEFIV